jgi:hypothetical protein
MAGRLVVFATSPTRQLLPQKTDCTSQYLYGPHIPNNVESWQVFPSDEGIYSFIQMNHLSPRRLYPWKRTKF